MRKLINKKWICIGIVALVIILIAYAGYTYTQKESDVSVNDIKIPNLLLQSSLQPYTIVDVEIYNFKNAEMFAYFSEFYIYANDKLIGSKKESKEEIWSVKEKGKREVKLYLNVTGEELAELLKKDEYLTVKGTLHIYGYANEELPTGIERSEVDIHFEKRKKPSIYNYNLSYASPENLPEEVLKQAEDILRKRLVCFNVIDYYIIRNNSRIRVYFGNESQETINDVCREGKFEFRSKINPMDRIEIGMELNDIQNITEHVFYGDDIERVHVAPFRQTKDSPWGVSFQLSKEGAEKLKDAVKKYKYDPEFSEAYEFYLLMLIDDKVAYNMPVSRALFRELLRGKPIYGIYMTTGFGETGYNEARKLICYLRTGPLPFKMEVEK